MGRLRVADFGCGIGAVTRMLAEMAGPSGSVTGIDANEDQLVQAGNLFHQDGLSNVLLWKADVCATRLPSDAFDLVYCRFPPIHLPDPGACLREMSRVLKPGGIIVVEDGDLSTAGSVPPTALNAFSELFTKLGPKRGVDYLLEASQECIDAGLITREQLDRTLDEMQIAMDDPNVLVLTPRMSLVWARKGR